MTPRTCPTCFRVDVPNLFPCKVLGELAVCKYCGDRYPEKESA